MTDYAIDLLSAMTTSSSQAADDRDDSGFDTALMRSHHEGSSWAMFCCVKIRMTGCRCYTLSR